jgi:hypothetical protein
VARIFLKSTCLLHLGKKHKKLHHSSHIRLIRRPINNKGWNIACKLNLRSLNFKSSAYSFWSSDSLMCLYGGAEYSATVPLRDLFCSVLSSDLSSVLLRCKGQNKAAFAVCLLQLEVGTVKSKITWVVCPPFALLWVHFLRIYFVQGSRDCEELQYPPFQLSELVCVVFGTANLQGTMPSS